MAVMTKEYAEKLRKKKPSKKDFQYSSNIEKRVIEKRLKEKGYVLDKDGNVVSGPKKKK